MPVWINAFFEMFVVLAFGLGWVILEWQARRLDQRRKDEEQRAASDDQDS